MDEKGNAHYLLNTKPGKEACFIPGSRAKIHQSRREVDSRKFLFPDSNRSRRDLAFAPSQRQCCNRVVIQFAAPGLTTNGFPTKTLGNDATPTLVMPADFWRASERYRYLPQLQLVMNKTTLPHRHISMTSGADPLIVTFLRSDVRVLRFWNDGRQTCQSKIIKAIINQVSR